MSVQTIHTPHLGANDSEAKLVDWLIQPGVEVSPGTVLCALETTKATIDVEAAEHGFVFPLIKAGETIETGAALAVLADSANFNIAAWQIEQKDLIATRSADPTRKAQLLMKRHNLNPAVLPPAFGERINEADVETYLAKRQVQHARLGLSTPIRLAILGGVSGGGALIVIDAARRMENMLPIAIYDRNPQFHDQSVLGVPVLGAMEDRMDQDHADGLFDVLIIAFNRNLPERDQLFSDLTARGYTFANVIDPKAELRSMVEIGTGNLILSHCYIGACSRIGSNNFISANVALEHGNILGNSCAFGPGVFTSGNVTIGNRVRFGTGVYIEPSLEIGDDAVIGSGQTLVTGVAPGKMITSRAKG